MEVSCTLLFLCLTTCSGDREGMADECKSGLYIAELDPKGRCITVNALRCVVCSYTAWKEGCNWNKCDCLAPLDTCMTTVDTLGNPKASVKLCVRFLTCSGAANVTLVDPKGDGTRVTCCRTRLCNVSSAMAMKLHPQSPCAFVSLICLTSCLF